MTEARTYMDGYSDGKEWAQADMLRTVEPMTAAGVDAALARLAELEKQEPAYLLTPDGKCYAYGSAQPLSAGHADATLLKLYTAAGASPVEPSQAQPPAPSDAAIAYMTGYSDGREWAGATSQAQPEPVNQVLLKALSAMLTHSGMDEDEWSKPTFDQARAAIMLATTKTQECGMCGYVGTKTDAVGQCPRCHWDELQAQPERAEDSVNAKRYLWLRDEAYSARGKTPFIVIGRDDSDCYVVSGLTADEAIDEAIKQGGQHD